MTLLDTINALVEIAGRQPNIRTKVINDIYRLNAMPSTKYSVFGITQNTHRTEDDMLYCNLNLYYIDRLTTDSENETQIQSMGLEVLRNIIATFVEEYEVSIYNGIVDYHTFQQKFVDLCAGTYATVTFEIPLPPAECYDEF